MANTTHAVVRTDNMHGTDVRAELMSLKYMGSGDTATEIDNGNVIKVGDLMDGEREIFTGTTPAATDKIGDIALVASVETMYDERLKNLDEFTNEAGKTLRGYRMHSGQMFSVTKPALDGVDAPAVGNIVELKAGTKLNVAESATSGSTAVGKIIAVETTSRYTYYVIKVD